MKTKAFQFPFIGYDYGSEHGWKYDVLIGQYGNPVIGIRIKNIVEQYSADPERYEQFHTILNQVIAIIGEGHLVQKVDIFAKKRYVSEKENTYLQQKYSDHFNGRIYKTIDTLLLFTDLLDKKKSKYKFSEKAYKELRDKCEKVYMLLEQSECDPEWLFEKDFEYYIGGTLTMQFAEVPVFDNIKSTNEYLRIGSSFVKTVSFVDVENIELPNEIETYSRLGGSSTVAYLAVDNFSFLNELEAYQTIVYNQVIAIPPQVSRQRELEKKMKKHDGVAKNAPSNAIVAQEIQELLHDIAVNGQLIVDAHFSLVFACDTLEKMEKTQSTIESKLFTKGIIISKNAYNQME